MTRYARVRRWRRLQTPVWSYIRPDTGRRVTLIATMPVGRPGYYRALRAVITRCQARGAVVHRDTDILTRLLPLDSTLRERLALAQLARHHDLVARHAGELGWTTRAKVLTDPSWQIHDLPAVDQIRRIGVDLVTTETAHAVALLTHAAENGDTALFRTLTAMEWAALAEDRASTLKIIGSPLDTVVGERTIVALEALHNSDRDVALVWGAGYLPGFATYLAARGFHLDRERWHLVGRLPTITPTGGTAPVQTHPHGHTLSLARQAAPAAEQ